MISFSHGNLTSVFIFHLKSVITTFYRRVKTVDQSTGLKGIIPYSKLIVIIITTTTTTIIIIIIIIIEIRLQIASYLFCARLFQVQLNEVTRITGIITKGRNVVSGDTAKEFITKFRVLHSLDGKSWEPYSSINVSDQVMSVYLNFNCI